MNMTRIFFKRLLFYMAVCMIPLVLVVTFVMVNIQRTHAEEMQDQMTSSLTQLQGNIEEIMAATSYQNQLLSNIPSLSNTMKRLLRRDSLSYTEASSIRLIQDILAGSVNSNPNIQSVLFYYDGVSSFYSTDFGVSSASTYRDMGWLAGCYQAPADRDVWVQMRQVDRFGKDTTVLTIYQRVANTACTIITNVYPEKLQGSIETGTGDSWALFILDNNNYFLLANREGRELVAKYEPDIFHFLLDGKEESHQYFYPVKISGDDFYLSYIDSYLYGVKYVSLMDNQRYYLAYYNSFRLFLFCFIFLSFLSIGLAAYVTTQNFRQIRILLNAFHANSSPGEEPQRLWGEYDALLKNIVHSYVYTSNLEKTAAESKARQKTNQLAMLQAQINPHFLMNTLQTIQMEVQGLGDYGEKLAGVIDDLSYILRESLQNIDQAVTVEQELSYLRRYSNILYFRYQDKFIIFYDYPDEVLEIPLFRLVLQPLIENSIYHGLKPKEGRGYVRIRIRLSEGYLHWRITDNGVGIPPEHLARLRKDLRRFHNTVKGHIGLMNVNQRLVLHYGIASMIQIFSLEGFGTSIRFITPVVAPSEEVVLRELSGEEKTEE